MEDIIEKSRLETIIFKLVSKIDIDEGEQKIVDRIVQGNDKNEK